MQPSLGKMSAHEILNLREQAAGTTDEIVAAFLQIGEAIASRWIETQKGVLLLQMVPDDGASGAIYIFDRQREQWFMLSFEALRRPVHAGEIRPRIHRIRPVPLSRTARSASRLDADRQRLIYPFPLLPPHNPINQPNSRRSLPCVCPQDVFARSIAASPESTESSVASPTLPGGSMLKA